MLVTGDYRHLFESTSGAFLTEKTKYIGYLLNGDLVSVAAFDNLNGVNIDIHCVCKSMPRAWLKAIYEYSFELCECKRMTALVDSDNQKIQKILPRLGFLLEGRMRSGLPDSDLLIYGCLSGDYKYG